MLPAEIFPGKVLCSSVSIQWWKFYTYCLINQCPRHCHRQLQDSPNKSRYDKFAESAFLQKQPPVIESSLPDQSTFITKEHILNNLYNQQNILVNGKKSVNITKSLSYKRSIAVASWNHQAGPRESLERSLAKKGKVHNVKRPAKGQKLLPIRTIWLLQDSPEKGLLLLHGGLKKPVSCSVSLPRDLSFDIHNLVINYNRGILIQVHSRNDSVTSYIMYKWYHDW